MGFGRNNLKKRIILSHSIRGSWLVVMGKESVAIQVAPSTWQYERLVVDGTGHTEWTGRQRIQAGTRIRYQLQRCTPSYPLPLARPCFLKHELGVGGVVVKICTLTVSENSLPWGTATWGQRMLLELLCGQQQERMLVRTLGGTAKERDPSHRLSTKPVTGKHLSLVIGGTESLPLAKPLFLDI